MPRRCGIPNWRQSGALILTDDHAADFAAPNIPRPPVETACDRDLAPRQESLQPDISRKRASAPPEALSSNRHTRPVLSPYCHTLSAAVTLLLGSRRPILTQPSSCSNCDGPFQRVAASQSPCSPFEGPDRILCGDHKPYRARISAAGRALPGERC